MQGFRILICFKRCSVCVCVCVCVCMRMFWTWHVCGCMSVEEAGVGERGRECESEICTFISFTFYFIVILNVPSWVLSPCVKGKFTFLCFVYWWIIKIYLIWFDRENIRLLEDAQESYDLLTQSLKTDSVVLKKREAWVRIVESVNAVGGQGGRSVPSRNAGRTSKLLWKTSQRLCASSWWCITCHFCCRQHACQGHQADVSGFKNSGRLVDLKMLILVTFFSPQNLLDIVGRTQSHHYK